MMNSEYDLGDDHVQIRLTGMAVGETNVTPLFPSLPSYEVLADAHQLQLQLIDENADNLIPVWFTADKTIAKNLYKTLCIEEKAQL